MLAFTLFFSAIFAGDFGNIDYVDAWNQSAKNNKPIVCYITADYCIPCKYFKKDILARYKEEGLLDKVNFVILNKSKDKDSDRTIKLSGETLNEKELADKISKGYPRIPALVCFSKVDGKWVKRIAGYVTSDNWNKEKTYQANKEIFLKLIGEK